MFVDNIIAAADEVVPKRLIRIKNRCDPLVTGEIIHKMYRRDFLLCKAKNEKQFDKKKELLHGMREPRSQIRKDLYSMKREFFEDQIKEAGNSPKSLWIVLKRFSGLSKKQNIVSTLKHDGILMTEASIVADAFNKYFTRGAEKLASKMKRSKANG